MKVSRADYSASGSSLLLADRDRNLSGNWLQLVWGSVDFRKLREQFVKQLSVGMSWPRLAPTWFGAM